MKAVISVDKPVGFTPNQIIKKIRIQFPHFQHEKIGFAGRLDPMAHGVLLLLVGDENKNREQFLNLPKTYQFTALLGLETDSYDLLGLITSPPPHYKNPPDNFLSQTEQFVQQSIGGHTQPYPPFSTKPVAGKQLFKWAREGKVAEIEIPTKEIEIFSFKQLNQSTINLSELEDIINDRIPKIEGFFRQTEILQKWQDFFQATQQKTFTTSLEVLCSTGTYVRSLVQNLGQKLGCGAVTLEIYRTKVGDYAIKDSIKLTINEPNNQK